MEFAKMYSRATLACIASARVSGGYSSQILLQG